MVWVLARGRSGFLGLHHGRRRILIIATARERLREIATVLRCVNVRIQARADSAAHAPKGLSLSQRLPANITAAQKRERPPHCHCPSHRHGSRNTASCCLVQRLAFAHMS